MSWAPCVDDLLPASWNGIPFWVEGDTGTYGRRLITHEYPMRDTAFQEDMGEKNSEWKVKGYLYGQGCEAIKDALIASARSGGAGLLVLPAEGSLSSRLVTLQVQRSKDKQVWFDLDFQFKRDDGAFSTPFSTPIYEGLLSSALTNAVGLCRFYSTRSRPSRTSCPSWCPTRKTA